MESPSRARLSCTSRTEPVGPSSSLQSLASVPGRSSLRREESCSPNLRRAMSCVQTEVVDSTWRCAAGLVTHAVQTDRSVALVSMTSRPLSVCHGAAVCLSAAWESLGRLQDLATVGQMMAMTQNWRKHGGRWRDPRRVCGLSWRSLLLSGSLFSSASLHLTQSIPQLALHRSSLPHYSQETSRSPCRSWPIRST